MAKFLIFFVIIVVIVVGILLFLYFYYEKPKQNDALPIEQVQLYVYAFDKYNRTQISTDFIIYKNGVPFQNGTTMTGGGYFVNVTINNSYIIKSINKIGQNYYTASKDVSYFGTGFPPQRIELSLEQPGDINFTNIILNDNPTTNIIEELKLSTENRDIKDVVVCVTWSVNIIGMNVMQNNISARQTSIFPEYKNYDKCYIIGIITKTNSTILTLMPTAYIDRTNRDYIEAIIIDQDCFKGDCKVIMNNTDLGMINKVVRTYLF